MDEAFDVQIRRLLDQFDAKCRAVEERKLRVKADEDQFDRAFADLIATVVKPVFVSLGTLLTERGHLVTISEEQPVNEPGASANDTGVSIRIAPVVSGKPLEPGQVPWLSIATRRYNRTVSIRSGNLGSAATGATGPRGDYQLAQIDVPLVEAEVLKFIRAILAGA